MTSLDASDSGRANQADRRARSRAALIEAAAIHITRYGYADLVLERVASDAGYTRGALYHLFANKEELVLAVVESVSKSWYEEVAFLLADERDPVGTLIAAARGTAVYTRHEKAKALMRLRTDFAGINHPIANAIDQILAGYAEDVARLVTAGRAASTIPPGPPAEVVAQAYIGAMEGVVNHLSDHAPFDAIFARRALLGVLGLPPTS